MTAPETPLISIASAREATRLANGEGVPRNAASERGALLLLTVVVVTASVQDRDGAKSALLATYLRSGVRFVFADGAFAGRLLSRT